MRTCKESRVPSSFTLPVHAFETGDERRLASVESWLSYPCTLISLCNGKVKLPIEFVSLSMES